MIPFRRIVERILSPADVRIHVENSPAAGHTQRPWDICVREPRFFRKALLEGSIGFGEAYMDGWWCCADVEELVSRLLRANIHNSTAIAAGSIAIDTLGRLVNRQSRKGALEVAERHYNLDLDLFKFLPRPVNLWVSGRPQTCD